MAREIRTPAGHQGAEVKMKHQTPKTKHQGLIRRVLAWINEPITELRTNRRGGRLGRWLVFHGQIS